VNGDIVRLTFRQLAGQRWRLLLTLVFALLPVVAAVALRLSADPAPDARNWPRFDDLLNTVYGGLIAGTLLPLVALIFGTSAINTEVEDGTAIYLLGRPISRREIFLSKLAVAWPLTAGVAAVSTLVSGIVMVGGLDDGPRTVAALTAAIIPGALVYTAVFLALAAATTRAFVIGLFYIFVWEGLVVGLFSGARVLSIGEYTLGLAGLLADLDPRLWEPALGGVLAVVLGVVVTVAAINWGVRRLQRFELGEAG
jgi:hypothetical protein